MSLYVQVFQLADSVTIVRIEHDVEVPENHLSLYGFKTQDSLAAKYLMHQCCGSSCNRFLECCFQGKGLSHLFSKMCIFFTVLSLQLRHPEHSTAS